jgi:hypothetical protein
MCDIDYKANFLWPHNDGSIEESGYELVNGRTEKYRKQWWDILLERIESEKIESIRQQLEDVTRERDEANLRLGPYQSGNYVFMPASIVGLLFELLRSNPYPHADTRWQTVDVAINDALKQINKSMPTQDSGEDK